MMSENTLLIERIPFYEKMKKALHSYKVIYIGCHTGWGKTIATEKYFQSINSDYGYGDADSNDFFDVINETQFKKKKRIILDNLYCITDSDEQNKIMDYIAASSSKFVLLSRTDLPPYLKPFYTTKQLVCIGYNDLAFTCDEIQQILKMQKIEISSKDIKAIKKDTQGYPLAVNLICRHLKGTTYNDSVYESTKRDLFDCFDYSLFCRWSSEIQTFLMDLSIVESFNSKLASMITGRPDAEQNLFNILNIGSFLTLSPPDTYCFKYPIFKEYLLYKQKENQSQEHIQRLYQNAGLFYELDNNLIMALKYYNLANNTDKLSSLLIENARNHAGNGQFYETAKYYTSLSKEQIEIEPDLMCAMSMLYSLRCDPKSSEYWYQKLYNFSKNINKKDNRYKVAKEKLMYLNIALPHRGSDNILSIITDTAKMCLMGKMSLQEMSVTGNAPSLLNGGKDFCSWVANDKVIYTTMKKPLEIVLGKCAAGLADTALGESFYYKSADLNFTEVMAHLNNGYSQAMLRGTLQMQFASIGVMARVFIAQDSIETAKSLVENFKDRAAQENAKELMPNIDAVIAHIKMLLGDNDSVDEWMTNVAPDELETFFVLLRNQYLVKVRAYIINEKYMEALSLLNMLTIYYTRYGRNFGVIECSMLKSIVMYRMKDNDFEPQLLNALALSEKYGFTRVVADEGMAVLEPLSKVKYNGSEDYYDNVLRLTRQQAVNYPNYLVSRQKQICDLTAVEKSVLKLISQGMKNENIASILGITLRTVKFHSTNIYSKLSVKNRAQAIKVAAENGLI